MQLTPTPTFSTANPTPPARWARWHQAPVARIDYGTGSTAAPWHEAWIPTQRSITGERVPTVMFAGTSRATAIDAARALATQLVSVTYDVPGGRSRTVQVHPAIGVLRDAKAGAYWLAELRASVRSKGTWVEAPHSIDGPAFEGTQPFLHAPSTLAATKELIAIVGGTTVVTPGVWTDAPDDSLARS